MGGDVGPSIVIPGAELAAIRHPTYRFLLFGDRAIIAPLLEQHPKLKARAEIRHTDVAVGMTEKPSQALRRGRGKSSMWQAIEAVRDGRGPRRCIRRQHRCPDGHVALCAENPSGHLSVQPLP